MPAHARTARGRYRTLIVVALALASIGAVVPFGLSSELTDDAMSPLEWVLAGLALAALVGLILDLAGVIRAAWPLAVTGFVWAVITVYVAVAPDATFLWHLGNALVCGALAVLALTAWRLAALEARTP